MTKRYINIRPMFVFFIGLMAGIAFSYLFLSEKISFSFALVSSLLFVGLAITIFIYASYTEGWNKKFKARKDVSAILRISSILIIVSFVLGIILSSFPLYKVMSAKEYYDDIGVEGVVSEYVLEKEKYTACILTDCIVDGEKQELDILLYTSSYVDIELGDKISIITSIDKFLASDSYGFSNLIDGIGYSAYVNYGDIEFLGNDATIKDKIKNETRDILSNRLSDDNADIMFSIIFGESSSIDKEIKEQFSYAGISHILAVSGLHISVLFSILYFVLRKCKLKKVFSLVIMGVLLLFYSYLCSFSSSVCRASIMTMLVLLCEIYKKQYDGLSGLSIAGIIILLISPLQFFSVSFRLSFLCVFAIITFVPFLTKIFTKIKCPEKLASLLAISISITIVTLPVMMNTFEKVSILGVITNIFVIPIFSVLYTLVLAIILVSFIIRPISILLYVPNLFLHIIKVISDYIASIPFAIFKVFNVSYILLFLVAVLCIVVHFLLVSTKSKIFISSALVCLLVGYLICELLPLQYTGNMLTIYYSNNSNIVFYTVDDSLTMIGSDITTKELSNNMKDMRLYDINQIVAYDFSLGKLDELLEICTEYNVDDVYLPSRFSNLTVAGMTTNFIYYDAVVSIGNLAVYPSTYYEDIDSVYFKIKEDDFLFVGDVSKTQATYLKNEYSSIEHIITKELENIDYESTMYENIICYKTEKIELKNVLNLKLCDKITIRV